MQTSLADSVERTDGPVLSLLRLLDPEVLAHPYGVYRALRERDPVYWDPYMHAWVVTGYAEVVTVLKDFSADRAPAQTYLDELGLSLMKPFATMMRRQMLFMHGSMHTRLRNLCAAVFTSRRVEELSSVIESVADRLIANIIPSGRADLVLDFASPFPAIVAAKLLGVPEEDHYQLGVWAEDLAEVLGNFQHHPDRVAQIIQSLEDFESYVAEKMREQRRNPGDGLIHVLMTAEAEGERLSDEDVIANTIITLIGGYETTMNVIASGFVTLLRNPECLEKMRTHPEIIPSAVEELLRFESPVQYTARIAATDAQLGNQTIKKGARVVAVLAAANRDPSRFHDPDRLDLLRTDNRHLAFGWGAHCCFGAPLARIEAQIAFRKLLRALSRPALIDQKLHWRCNVGLRGLSELNITFESRPSMKTFPLARCRNRARS